MNREKLKDWLSTQFYRHDDSLGPCCKLICRHLGNDGRAKTGDVFQIMVPNNEKVVNVDDDELEIMTNQIEASVLEDAEGIGGVQKYQLLSYHTKVARQVCRYTFRQAGPDLDEYEDELTENATTKGHMGQMMRHNEALTRIAVMGANQALNLQNRTISRQAELIENLLGKRIEEFELIENLQSQQHERDLATKAEENKQLRYQELFEKGKILLPVLANKIAGRKLLPEESDPMVETLKSFAETLSPAQISDIMPKLKPEQQIALMEFLSAMHDKEDADEQKQLAKGGSNGT